MCTFPQSNRHGITYACGKCTQCHNMYLRHWTFRLQRQLDVSKTAVFVTLTYDSEHITWKNGLRTLVKKDMQDFFKRLRKSLPALSIKYLYCGEYGTKNKRPHYHAIILGVDMNDFNTIHKSWSMGHVHIGTVTPASIAYTLKYSLKGDDTKVRFGLCPPYIQMSKGLGEDFAFHISFSEYHGVDRNGKSFVRRTKIRTPKAHFADKLATLTDMPFYKVPDGRGGTVKMSIPKFYLRAANYDHSQLGELYKVVMQEKLDKIPIAVREAYYLRLKQQQQDAVLSQTQLYNYSLSKRNL